MVYTFIYKFLEKFLQQWIILLSFGKFHETYAYAYDDKEQKVDSQMK